MRGWGCGGRGIEDYRGFWIGEDLIICPDVFTRNQHVTRDTLGKEIVGRNSKAVVLIFKKKRATSLVKVSGCNVSGETAFFFHIWINDQPYWRCILLRGHGYDSLELEVQFCD